MNTVLISLLTFLVGLLLGHRFALWRDTRKEFNTKLEPIAKWLHAASTLSLPYPPPPSAYEVDTYLAALRWPKDRTFRKQLDIYKKGLTRSEYQDPSTGYRKYRPDPPLEDSVKNMRKLARPR